MHFLLLELEVAVFNYVSMHSEMSSTPHLKWQLKLLESASGAEGL